MMMLLVTPQPQAFQGGEDPVRGENPGRGSSAHFRRGNTGMKMKMARVCSAVCGVSALIPLLLVATAAAASDLFDNQLGDISYCKNQCQVTIRNKKAAKDSIMNACYRGCRLYSICQFVNGNTGFNNSKEECQGACQEAYSKLLEQEACSTGCMSQPAEPEIQRRKLKALTNRPKPVSVMDALFGWCNDIVSSAQSFMSSTWTFYLQADDGKVVVFQSEPEIDYYLPELQASHASVANKPWPEGNPQTQKPQSGERLNEEKNAPKSASKGKHSSQNVEDTVAEHDFLGCMSRRSGLPRWILATCLMLSIMVMLWLSCASLVTAPDQHVKTQLSINGDKEFLDYVPKVNPYHLTSVIAVAVGHHDEEKETGPLPVKVDLNKTSL
ncbi:transmembrane protein 59-like precursor [Silurus asotus]|uniref:Transmembrane protein 59-like n=1 Tax=Silurus asotus TaxID=30991 RepID=A0AAD5AR10_SILAS|nr:transmembrane protein 59-like precursor [Silurus asotus]